MRLAGPASTIAISQLRFIGFVLYYHMNVWDDPMAALGGDDEIRQMGNRVGVIVMLRYFDAGISCAGSEYFS